MIQKTTERQLNAVLGQAPCSASFDRPEEWGQWVRDKHYSLEVNQHPIRARMCGFGDKDRRPLAPAAVAKMVVRREDNSIVDVDDIDVDFFVVTVDLWSADGKQEMNLVLHPSASDRYIPVHTAKPRKRGSTAIERPSRSSPYPTPVERMRPPTNHAPTNDNSCGNCVNVGLQQIEPIAAPLLTPSTSYNNYPFSSASDAWSAQSTDPQTPWSFPSTTPTFNRASFQLDSTPSVNRSSPVHLSTPYESTLSDLTASFRSCNDNIFVSQPQSQPQPQVDSRWSQDPFVLSSLPELDSWSSLPESLAQQGQLQQEHDPHPQIQNSYQAFTQTPAVPLMSVSVPSQQHEAQVSPTMLPLPRHTYTRTLVGPLSANAQRLKDEHRKPGIFFLFQDLSIRTEGTFRLRMRLMNVGEPPAPNGRSNVVNTGVSPVLAQIFTEPFTVYSAKRFPGVPSTTALSIAFGNQGQKLPLRNRHKQLGRQGAGRASSDDDSS